MKVLKKILKIILSAILILLLLTIVWWFWPERTPKIRSDNTTSIASLEYITIGGLEQSVLIRSHNTENPILLFLHGGPGMPMMYMAHEFQRPLETDFTVVQWDRRGAGKTYSRNKPSAESMNIRQLIDDAYELIDTLKRRYGQKKIILVGHSFGTYLGSIMINERPDLFSAYISIGQVVDDSKSLVFQEEFIREQAIINNRNEILDALDAQNNTNIENWLFEFGGELKHSTSFFPLIWSGLQAPEYTLQEAIELAKGSSFSSAHMKYNVLTKSIYHELTDYEVPVYFFVGQSDYTTPYQLITEYYEMVTAPKKELVIFKNSAHFPFFEEPDQFCLDIKRVLSNYN
ncbi:MAG: alpha/beta hydrolase [Flavobacteriaceae bacterium]|nr:alpha/beta hydrolase [Flavobacteriaceae bacterium]